MTGKVTVTIPADKNPGDEVTGKVLSQLSRWLRRRSPSKSDSSQP